eukprot:g177.t1
MPIIEEIDDEPEASTEKQRKNSHQDTKVTRKTKKKYLTAQDIEDAKLPVDGGLPFQYQVAFCVVIVGIFYELKGLRMAIIVTISLVIALISWRLRFLALRMPRVSIEDGVYRAIEDMERDPEDEVLQVEGAMVIYRLCVDRNNEHKENRRKAYKKNVMRVLKKGLDNFGHSPLYTQWCCAAVCVIVSDDSEDYISSTHPKFPAEVLVSLLKEHREFPQTVRRLITLMGAFIRSSDPYRNKAFKTDVLEILPSFMEENIDVENQKWAIWLGLTIAQDREKVYQKLMKLNYVQKVVGSMERMIDNEIVQNLGIMFLGALFNTLKRHSARSLATSFKVVPLILKLEEKYSANANIVGCSRLIKSKVL